MSDQVSLPPAARFVGQSVTRKEDKRHLTGHGNYVDDVVLPGMLHAAFRRSDVARGRIAALDVSAAEAVDGVAAVFVGKDLNRDAGPATHTMLGGLQLPFRPLADDDVRFVGDPLALVIAKSRYIAEDACDLIEVEYEPMEPAADYKTAVDDTERIVHPEVGRNAFVTVPFTKLQDDLDEAFAGAAHVVEATIEQHRYLAVPMECRGIVASWDAGREDLEIYCANQSMHETRNYFARFLDVPESHIRVSMRDVGGGFGQKMFVIREESAVVLASKRLGRPVKWIEDRRENLTAAPHSRNEVARVRVAVDDEGVIEAIAADAVCDVGAYAVTPGGMNVLLLPGPYKIPRLGFSTATTFSNTMGRGAYRGPWMFETTAREMMLDHVAHELGVDPAELRRKNILRRSDLPYTAAGGQEFLEISPGECLDQALEMLDYQAFRAEQARARAEGRLLGVGMSVYVEPSGMRGGILGTEAATVKVEESGRVTAYLGTSSHGQSIETTMAQIVADSLGVPYDDVTVIQGDTSSTPYGPGTGGSRTAVISGGATRQAALKVRDKVIAIASHRLEASPSDLDIAEGSVFVRGTPARALTIAEISALAYGNINGLPPGTEPGLEATARFTPERDTTWSNSAHVCVVEIDAQTWLPKIVRYIVSEDCGRMINPMVVEGQVFGGVVQGLGGVLLESFVYDPDGNPLTTTFMDYLLPTTTEVPDIEVGHMQSESTTNPGGYKGVGEGGAIGSPAAVANAIGDALAHLGVRVTKTPLGPNEIFELVQAARTAG